MKRREWSKQDLNNCLYEPRATYVFQDCIRLRSILASALLQRWQDRTYMHTRTQHIGTDTTYVRRKAWFPAKTSSFNLLAHGSVLVWTRFFRPSESNEQYLCVLHYILVVLVSVAVGWALRGPSLLLVKKLSGRSRVLMEADINSLTNYIT